MSGEMMDLGYDRQSVTVTTPIGGHEAVLQEVIGPQERKLLRDIQELALHRAHLNYLQQMITSFDGIQKPPPQEEEATERFESEVRRVYVPDQEFLLIEACKLVWLDGIWEFRYQCWNPKCRKVSQQTYDLKTLKLRALPEDVPDKTNPTVEVVLPRTKKKAVVGLITTKQELELMDEAADTGETNLIRSDFMALRSLNGRTDFPYSEVEYLPNADKKALRQAKQKLLCGYNTMFQVMCPHCNTAASLNMLMRQDFFFWPG